MFLYIHPNGSKYWRMKYRFAGKEKLLALGVYPEVSLKEARDKRFQARKLVAAGIDPSEKKKAVKEAAIAQHENAFEKVGTLWFQANKAKWLEDHAERIKYRLKKMFILEPEHLQTTAAVRQIFRDAFEHAGLAYCNPHSFRHTLTMLMDEYCSTMLEKKAWSQNLGHENLATTVTSYCHVDTHRQGEILKRLTARNIDGNEVLDQILERLIPTMLMKFRL